MFLVGQACEKDRGVDDVACQQSYNGIETGLDVRRLLTSHVKRIPRALL